MDNKIDRRLLLRGGVVATLTGLFWWLRPRPEIVLPEPVWTIQYSITPISEQEEFELLAKQFLPRKLTKVEWPQLIFDIPNDELHFGRNRHVVWERCFNKVFTYRGESYRVVSMGTDLDRQVKRVPGKPTEWYVDIKYQVSLFMSRIPPNSSLLTLDV